MSKKTRQSRIKKLWGKRTSKEIADILGVSETTIRRDLKEMKEAGKTPPTVESRVNDERAKEYKRTQSKLEREMTKRIISLEQELEVVQCVRNFRSHYEIPQKKSKKTQAIAFMVASDWHLEEIVHKWQVNGVNRFNEKICKERIERFFRHGVKLLKMQQLHTQIDTMVVALLGDFISGSIHEELMEGNRIPPTDAILEAQAHLASGIRYILKNTNVNLIIPCSMGNHGRMTPKRRIATEAGNNLERIMYFALADMFKDDKRVKFIIGSGYHTYLYLFDKTFTVRLHHGHNIRYAGGVGGITIPINKAIAQWDKVIRADLDVLGHYHQLKADGKWIENGSLIGYNAFALSINAEPEAPQQAFFLIDRDLGKTLVAPIILVEDR